MEFFTSGDWLHPLAIAFYIFFIIFIILGISSGGGSIMK